MRLIFRAFMAAGCSLFLLVAMTQAANLSASVTIVVRAGGDTVSGAKVIITGANNAEATTDGEGRAFFSLARGNITITATTTNANGVVDREGSTSANIQNDAPRTIPVATHPKT